jgi:hypothetical protein
MQERNVIMIRLMPIPGCSPSIITCVNQSRRLKPWLPNPELGFHESGIQSLTVWLKVRLNVPSMSSVVR